MRYCLVRSESCDWFVIPVNKLSQWNREDSFADDTPEYATYVNAPEDVHFTDDWIEPKDN